MKEENTIEVQIMLAHHEQQISDLNDVITSQWKEIDLLKQSLKRVLDKLDQKSVSEGGNDDSLTSLEKASLEKPPHY